ncbi:MAG: DUF2199 domain-containing protein [Steroidobacteraceae bacterium]
MNETIDPRWALLQNSTWACSSCSETHRGTFDLGSAKPDLWQGPEDRLPNSMVASSANCLTEDFCVLDGEHYFIRCVLRLPLVGAPSGEYFAFGVWSSLSKKNFTVYTETFDGGEQEERGPWFGWFSNRLKGYPDTLNLKCQVHPQAARERPWIELENTEHPLARDAFEGITYERLLEIYAAYGHSLSSGLS